MSLPDNITGGMVIAVSDGRTACHGEADVIERVRKAMRACHDHWMEPEEPRRFRSAVAAAILESAGAEKDRLERSAKAVSQIGAVLEAARAGLVVDLDASDIAVAEDIIPLLALWRETRPAPRGDKP